MKRLPSLLLLACTCLAACVTKPDYKPDTAQAVVYRFDAGEDMGSLFRFTAAYTDGKGKQVSERISALPWSCEVAVTPPFDAHLEVAFQALSDYPEQESYHVGFNGSIDLDGGGNFIV